MSDLTSLPPPRMPQPVTDAPHFTTASARAAGVSVGRLQRGGLVTTAHGVRSRVRPTCLEGRLRALQLVLPPAAAYSHLTAARLWELPLPAWADALDDVHVIGPSSAGRVRRRGVVGHRGAERRRVVARHGIRLTGLADTWVDLGELGPLLSLDDLVVAGDAVVARRSDHGDLAAALATRVRPRRGRDLAAALALVRAGARSPMETRARVMCVRAGLPEPELNATLEATDGGWLGVGDLVWRAQRVVGEYQGAHHATRAQRSADGRRTQLLGDEGWSVLEIFAEDVYDPHRRRLLLTRLARSLGVDPTRLRLG